MPQIKPPSELLNCSDLSSCFQAIYNLFFVIFLALAFLFFVYGAFQYLLSGASVFPKEEGKKRMINSLIALIVILIIPVILNMINPKIFKAKLQIPEVKKLIPPEYLPLSELTDEQIEEILRNPELQKKFQENRCKVIENSNNPCHRDYLFLYFGIFSNEASRICNAESGGDPDKESTSDKCKDGNSFSIGLFQINMVCHSDKLGKDPAKIFNVDCKNLKKIKEGKDKGKYNCEVIDKKLYEEIKRELKDPLTNIRLAVGIFYAAGKKWKPWTKASLCGLK